MILGQPLGKAEKVIVAASGGFDPLHVGHIEYLYRAKKLGTHLVVIVNSDDWLKRKKGYVFMNQEDRMTILNALTFVDEVVPAIEQEDMSVSETLDWIRPHIFAKGGDRYSHEIPEKKICDALGIEIVDGLGSKIRSSSEMVAKWKKN